MRFISKHYAKLSPNLKELRLHLCQTGETSKGVREYLVGSYVTLKKDNPKLPILIRECSGVQPMLWARFAFGREVSVSLTNLSATEIQKSINNIAK